MNLVGDGVLGDKLKALNMLRSGIPPEDVSLIHVDTSNFLDVIESLRKEIKSARATQSLRNIYLVAPRGLGKTHILRVLEKKFAVDSNYTVVYIGKPEEPILLIKSLIKSLGKENLEKEIQNYKVKRNLTTTTEVFQSLQESITNLESFNIAISYLDDPEFGFLSWKWLTDRLGPGEVSSLRFGRAKITKNIPDSKALELLKALTHFLRISSQKCLIILIDEFTRIIDLTPRKRKVFKGFLVDLINEIWPNGLFICFASTDLSWKEIEEDEYSVSIGLTRRARKIDLLGLSSVQEAEQIFERILQFFPSDKENDIREFVKNTKLIDKLYSEFQRNPGEIIRNLIERIEGFLNQIIVSKDSLTKEDILRIIRED